MNIVVLVSKNNPIKESLIFITDEKLTGEVITELMPDKFKDNYTVINFPREQPTVATDLHTIFSMLIGDDRRRYINDDDIDDDDDDEEDLDEEEDIHAMSDSQFLRCLSNDKHHAVRCRLREVAQRIEDANKPPMKKPRKKK